MTHPTPIRDHICAMVAACWSAQTAQNGENWSSQNASTGQCAVTACLMQDLLNMSVVRGQAILPSGARESHYWNEQFDLTGDQFEPGTTFEVRDGPQGREAYEYALSNPDTKARYDILRAKWNALYPDTPVG